MSSCCTLEKNNNLLILLVDLEKKDEQPRNLNNCFRDFFEKIDSTDGYHLNLTFHLTHRLTEKILYKDNYNKLHSYYTKKSNIKYSFNHIPEGVSDFIVGFVIGELNDEYYKIDSSVLNINFNLFFHKDIKKIEIKHFVAQQNISIFSHLDNVFKGKNLYISDNDQDNSQEFLPFEAFENLIKQFPNTTEVRKYRHSRIRNLLMEYLDIPHNFEEDYHKYIKKKEHRPISTLGQQNYQTIASNEAEKYKYLYEEFSQLLSNCSTTERNLQDFLYENGILKLLFPKYVYVTQKTKIKGLNTKKFKETEINKYPDFLCIDADGHIDVIELKDSKKDLLRKTLYRNNYVPSGELSNSIVQIEHYIYQLCTKLKENEEFLNKKHVKTITQIGIEKIKIVNPRGVLIIGRDCEQYEQKIDLEIIKRHYKNISDIITYDDLLRRLQRLEKSFYLNKAVITTEQQAMQPEISS